MSPNSTRHHLTQQTSGAFASLRERFTSGGVVVPSDPSTVMFRRIRTRLILWYAAVLALVLLAAGALLYIAMWQTVMGPVNSSLTNTASILGSYWQRTGTSPCSLDLERERLNVTFVACYDSTGTSLIGIPLLIGRQGATNQAPGFLDASLAQSARQNGSASDIVNGGNVGGYDLGAISRYTLVVRDPNTHQVLGVIQVGMLVGGQVAAMQALLTLLLVLGPLALILATIGGFFLSQRALDPARLAVDRQQRFIADASHELRTPLTLLRADAEVLLRGRERLTEDDASLLEDIVVETQHLSNIANNLLTLARLDSGAMHLESDVVDLATIASDAARRVDALAHERAITVRLGELTSVAVLGDAQLLAQATLALLDNALKYAGSGSEITLTTRQEGDTAILVVHDTGPGIAAEHLPLLGQRFYRPDKARSRAAGGAGLGLSVVRGLLALHHGTLTLESAPDTGTSAILRLPAITVHDRADTSPVPTHDHTTNGAGQHA